MAKKNYKLDKEEQAMLDAYEAGKLKSVPNVESEKKRIRSIFSNQQNKLHRINIRLTERDYLKAQELAMREGIPSATLLSSLLHKFFTGQIVDKAARS
ncbi:MAG: hypothetical protein K0R66_125 [Gammaproteobacteria bacterium]|jgi:predicted DNA binding CopG/RHH family protein|nr:hypothetical protein [Gammaproteobacteria bacterium]